MTLEIHANRGTPVEQQRFTWRELVQKPISKLDDDAFSRVLTRDFEGALRAKVAVFVDGCFCLGVGVVDPQRGGCMQPWVPLLFRIEPKPNRQGFLSNIGRF